ncbi:MAG: carbamoyl-phosphate synthase large subunit [Proteobacteria bacterium]|nr:carbamoyl-phosphate synthase large subunit [Pseudomonadota bacterium]
MTSRRLLIVNRGEVALRIMRSAAEMGYHTVAVYSDDDADSLHVSRADSALRIAGRGAAAYLDAGAIVEQAVAAQCWGVHPGYGFLAEQARFGAACEAAGLTFVGPTPTQLALFGNKLAAHDLARQCKVPTLPASSALASAPALADFRAGQGAAVAVVIKAAAGGGGRGMRVVAPGADGAALWAACTSEALAAFGDGSVYAERYIANARHIEVQVLGDGRGAVTHLWERDCSTQRRHQKLIEIAPAPHLDAETRDALLGAALRMARHANYRGLGTFEFLLDADTGEWFFIEANARLQVEHTVTEEVLGLDLVALQLRVANGASLAELGMDQPPAAPRGYAVQLRINAEVLGDDGTPRPASGRITRFEAATGPGIRVDSAARRGYAPSPAFDSLLAKLIVHTAGDFSQLLARARRAAAEFVIEGIATNLPLLQAVLAEPALASGALNTTYVEQHGAALMRAASAFERDEGEVTEVAGAARSAVTAPPGSTLVVAPMRASVISIDVAPGATVRRGQQLAVLEAMKMHHVVAASAGGIITGIVVGVGDVLDEGEALAFLAIDVQADDREEVTQDIDLDATRGDLEEVRAAHALTLDAARPEAVAKRRKLDARTARENVADLCDPDSFIEYGALAIAAQRRRRSVEDLMKNTPADGMIAGFGTVNAALFGADHTRCAVMAYDYTVLAGTQGHHNHKKKDRLFEIAAEWKTPIVFFTEGGGGRPGDVDTDELCMSWLDLKTFATWPKLSGVAPRIAVNAGRCYAGNAVIFGCADVTIATANSNIGLAGPAMIEGGGLGKFKPEDIGPIDVQTANGVVDIACADEREATAAARQLLGYFQGVSPHWTAVDQRRLRHLIPENRLRVYDVRTVIHALADEGSVLELRPHYGVGLLTCFIRIEGQPFGLIANDPRHLGGAIDGDGGEKGGRFLQLCDAYNVPVISLCDTPGFMVGPDSEKTAAVRRGSRLIIASANLRVPLFCIVLRKGYGLGAQAMCGGSTHQSFFTIAWPTAEMGPMGLEGAVELGFRKELEATPDAASRKALFDELVAHMYTKGKGVSVASVCEIDAVIDPAESRAWLLRGLRAAGRERREPRRFVDVW